VTSPPKSTPSRRLPERSWFCGELHPQRRLPGREKEGEHAMGFEHMMGKRSGRGDSAHDHE